jgi:diguanylate cyclase (GGDEF)-like protein/PAS domain S-box-containing protein
LTATARAVDSDLHFSILEALDEGILVLDRDAIIVACNPSAARVFEAPQEELIGSLLPMDRTSLPDRTPVDATNSPGVRALRNGETTRDVSLRITRLDGGERWVSVNYQPLRAPDEDEPRGLVVSITDVTDRRTNEDRIAHLAFNDGLTGLPNRAALEQALAPALARARRNGHAAALIYLDLDQFKLVNDSLGHAAGDEVLRHVAGRFSGRVRAGDLLARLGGDEFMVLLPDLGVDADDVALQVATDLVAELEEPIVIGASEFEIGASAGIALYPRDGEHGEELLRRADAALYETKRSQPGTVSTYEHRASDSSTRLTLSTRVRRALANDEFELHYQPIFELAERKPVGVEALIRWRDPEVGLIPPGDFIPLAEETGLIDSIGDWVIDTVLAQGEAWLDLGLAPQIAFNLSPRQLRRRGFGHDLARRIGASRMPASQLSIEITESVTMEAAGASLAVLGNLHDLGVTVAIDDFGAEFSSLSRLCDLPVDLLKIDRSFLRGVPERSDAAAIVTAIANLAAALEMRAVAEGVETAEQLDFLVEQGCPLAQGFHLGRPAPAAEIGPMLLSYAPAAK